ncbi:ATP-dependent DNA helicase PIF1 [Trifolium medium]|uniref:ATP-dependent DNA helicase n=1 Tax=Trifolium medium TaxID=97028 RepID=A0A392LWG5_9FABA|nr:ATP-dependent DNA helicase PIF1 [Trifolium medium]
MEISKEKLARFSRKLAIKKDSKRGNNSSSENVKPKYTNPNQVVFENSLNSKRKASRVPLSPLNPDSICTPNTDQNIPCKRIRTPNPKYFTPLSCVTNTSQYSSGQSSTTTIQHPLGTENERPKYTNPNEVVLDKVSNSNRKASRIPLSPLNPDSICKPNTDQNIPSKRIRTPNPKYFTPNDSVDSSSPSSEVIDPTSNTTKGKFCRTIRLQNKYIGVQRLDFDDDNFTNAPSNDTNDLECLKSTMYAKAESEGFINFGLPEFTCKNCFAELWFEERAEKSRNGKDIAFSICCQKGKVDIPLIKRPPKLLLDLINGRDPKSKNFRDNYRVYNSMFAFTSMGGQANTKINNGGGPPQFILSGQNYHRIGSLLPEPGTTPKFAQLYIYDTQNEVENRAAIFSSDSDSGDIDISLVRDLKSMLDHCNPLAKSFRKVRDLVESGNCLRLSLRLFRKRSQDSRMHNTPMADEVAGLIVGDFDDSEFGRDVIVNDSKYGLTRIHETHVLFLPLQYPLIFPWGENGWEPDIPHKVTAEEPIDKKQDRVTIREFMAFRIQERKMEFGNIAYSKRLFQQFVVDCYTMIEAQRLSYIRENQDIIRCDILSGLQEAIELGDIDASLVGKRIVLPDSFTGGPRYMFNNCQDAMGICKRFGYPDLFITVTCNANWPEIRDFVSSKGAGHKINTGRDIDKVISAEIPHPKLYPKLHSVVAKFMMHGPCGASNRSSPCMDGRHCSKFFPKKYKSCTTIDEDGYSSYKRRNTGVVVQKKGVKLDNGNVVPYNPFLLMRYQGHINVEYCNKSNAIKYLFKYVNKGPDRSNLEITNGKGVSNQKEPVDEIKRWYDCRYLSPSEAVWRTLKFDIHEKFPAVIRLSIHLENQQVVTYKDTSSLHNVVTYHEMMDTMFLAWFKANVDYEEGRNLTYAEFPTKFVYHSREREWQPRQKGYSIGRLTYVPVGAGELYYLRVLLTVQKGCTSYESIKTVKGITYKTFQEACSELGLLKDDQEFKDAIVEAYRTDGIVYNRRKSLNLPDLQIPDAELQNLCLIEINNLLMRNGRSLNDYKTMPMPVLEDVNQFVNKLIVDELNYDRTELAILHASLVQQLNTDQHSAYETIMTSVLSATGQFYFLYGYGGTGKTFLWKTLSAALRSQGKIVLNVASSGIASLLLPNGKTAHSTFCIPLEINEKSTCNVTQDSVRANLLRATSLFIWDEAPMMNRLCFEAFDRTMRDLMAKVDKANRKKPFGGKVVVLGGDFRQILPVIRKGSRGQIIKANVSSSKLWKHCKVLKLTKNMRLKSGTTVESQNEIKEFADWLLKIGDGFGNRDETGEMQIDIPEELCDSKDYFSCDTPCKSDVDYDVQNDWFTSEFLNDIKCSGIPNHRLTLKVGVHVMLLRNIDQASGLCNGTRLQVTDLGKTIITAKFITGKNIGETVFIPRMDLVPTDSGLPFKFCRRQFPICLCFAMTINKSQGQSLSKVGLYLPRPVFTHGQLYVAISRVTTKKGLKMVILDEDGKTCSTTLNVVYPEVFEQL